MPDLPTNYERQEVQKIEDDFQQKLSELNNRDALPIQDFLQLDGQKTYSHAKELVSANPNASNKEITAQLVQYVAFSSDNKYIRKIARKMVKEKWWENNG